MQPLQICIGPIIRIGRESWCLPYAGFFYNIWDIINIFPDKISCCQDLAGARYGYLKFVPCIKERVDQTKGAMAKPKGELP